MKDNKILATAVAAIFGASVATADISLSDNLTLSGFVDASYSNTDNGNRTESIGLDQVEVDFAFSGESVSAEVHLHNLDGDTINLEQAFVNYDLSKKLANVDHHDVMLGIPIYSDIPEIHNYIVQSENAFDETLRGIINFTGFKSCYVEYEVNKN